MKTFIQFLTLVGELTSIYVLCQYLTTLVLAAIIGGGAMVTFIGWVFIIVVAIWVVMPLTSYVFSWIRSFFDANLPTDAHRQPMGV